MVVENLAADTEMRMVKLRENVTFEQHLLGGKLVETDSGEDVEPGELCDDGGSMGFSTFGIDEEGGERLIELYDGLLVRSKRVPTLLEMALYEARTDLPFQAPLHILSPTDLHYIAMVRPEPLPTGIPSMKEYQSFEKAFSDLVPGAYLPKFFRPE